MFPEFTWSLVQSQHRESQNWRSILILMHMRFHDFSFHFNAIVIISQICQEKKGHFEIKMQLSRCFHPVVILYDHRLVLWYFIKIWLLKLAQTWLLTSVKRNAHTQRGVINSVGSFLFLYRHPSFQYQYLAHRIQQPIPKIQVCDWLSISGNALTWVQQVHEPADL